jgi:uncharacterized cupredoxin-like copper-binding protein
MFGRQPRKSTKIVVLTAVLGLVLAACGGGASPDADVFTAAPRANDDAVEIAPNTAAEEPAPTEIVSEAVAVVAEPVELDAEPVEVIVTLGEATLGEFTVDMSQSAFDAGVSYRFVVTNEGAVGHEFMVVAPLESGDGNMEEIDAAALFVIHEDDLPPGATVEVVYSFPFDTELGLEAACYVPGHYEAGMKTPIVVSG